MRDRGRAVIFQHAVFVSVIGQGCAFPPDGTATDDRAGIGKGVGQGMNEDQLRTADANNVTRPEEVVTNDSLGSNHRAVAAIEVTEDPLPARKEDLDVVSATTIVFEDDLVRRRTTDRRRLSGDEPEDVAPFSSFANDEISEFRHGLVALFRHEKTHYTLSSGGSFLQDAGNQNLVKRCLFPCLVVPTQRG